ncbi:peptidoglycan recognition protein family protein [Clostridium perfringens]|uniref:N-acetylmuramoyl-L-alanine amidase n=1 Tax=Clostridium perfringens TaxID=1502 RepID=A0A384T9G0_CLOPF|nr:peptidoglycan recognition family protein [Clostridium perfringens]AQS60703.1 PlyCP18 [Clostridium perfringens]EGT3620537.1 N-acetylmuramoyl-L-alanine amidase [Clostridium perfringens]MBO3312107.1 N-acetylmuramoyl-L-alanine amidase [Clostridium perfringens]MBO3327520.1 N-acetylmuramoyl-L-alanine amidase [Clostridium perfringens]MBO3415829.1 N-acetylmuramoyl-L-alanine amidase [Clostridium perfringens]
MEIKKVYLKGQEEAKGWNNPNKIIIHHPEYNGSIEGLNNIMRNMGYYMIGYNFYVRKDGTVYEGRPVWATGANCYGQNNSSIGVCFEGNYDKETEMPQAQFNAGVELIEYLKNKYGISEANGHKHYYNTACPGRYFPLERMLKSIDENIVNDTDTTDVPSSDDSNKKDFSTNARALVALDPRDNPSDNYSDLGEIYKDERFRVLAEVCDKGDFLPIVYWKDSEGRESGKVWVRSKQDYMMIDTYHKVFNVITELDARYEPSPNSSRMGYVTNGERLYVHRIEGNYALATYFAGNGYKTAWFTKKYIEKI